MLTRNSNARRRFSETSISTPRPPPLVRREIRSPKGNGLVRRSDKRQRWSGKRLTRLSAAAFALALYCRRPHQLRRFDLQRSGELGDDFQAHPVAVVPCTRRRGRRAVRHSIWRPVQGRHAAERGLAVEAPGAKMRRVCLVQYYADPAGYDRGPQPRDGEV
jgi:hypothetical protein